MSNYLREVLARGICPRCEKTSDTIEEQYSYRVYAGVFCRECAIHGYRDQCGHGPTGQGNPYELEAEFGERYEAEDPSDLE